jgi:ketosteroid isomerase-like protein
MSGVDQKGARSGTAASHSFSRGPRIADAVVLDASSARTSAEAWIAAWNSHDLERILDLFTDDVVLVSPRVVELRGDPAGTIRGKAALRDYFRQGLAAAPNLRFELRRVYIGIHDFAIEYSRHDGRVVVEVLEPAADGRSRRASVYYSKT